MSKPKVQQGQGAVCSCVITVVFPSIVAPGDRNGTCASQKHAGEKEWADYIDEDRLWIKSKCDGADESQQWVPPRSPRPDVDEEWGKGTTNLPEEEPWWICDEWHKKPKSSDSGNGQAAWDTTGTCSALIYIKAVFFDKNGRSILKNKKAVERHKIKSAYREWHKV